MDPVEWAGNMVGFILFLEERLLRLCSTNINISHMGLDMVMVEGENRADLDQAEFQAWGSPIH